MPRRGRGKWAKFFAGVTGGFALPVMIIFSSMMVVPVFNAPSACACIPPRVWFKVTEFTNSSDGHGALNGGGWIVTVRESSAYGLKLDCMFVKVSTATGRIVIRTPRIAAWPSSIHSGNPNETWYSMRTGTTGTISVTAMSRSTDNRTAFVEKAPERLEHTVLVFIDKRSDGLIDCGDSIIIFRDPDADRAIELNGGLHLQLFKHINADSKHYSVDRELGKVDLNWS